MKFKTSRKRIIRILFVTILVFCLIPILVLLGGKSVRHNFEYHPVPDRFLDASDMHGTRQFISYRPFPYTLFRPKYFLPDTVILYKGKDTEGVAKIYSVKSSINKKPLYIAEDARTGELIEIYHTQILAKD